MNFLVAKLEKSFPRQRISIFGQDNLITSSLPYYILATLSFVGLVLEQPKPFVLIAIVYVLLPLLDEIFSLDVRNPN